MLYGARPEASGPVRRTLAGAEGALMSSLIQRMRRAASSGWSPNSWAIRLTQPATPNRRTAVLIQLASSSTVGASDRRTPDAKSAAHRAFFIFNLVTVSLRGSTSGTVIIDIARHSSIVKTGARRLSARQPVMVLTTDAIRPGEGSSRS
jgi:hypothetical protein